MTTHERSPKRHPSPPPLRARGHSAVLIAVLAGATAACGGAADCRRAPPPADGALHRCALPGFAGRPYEVVVPDGPGPHGLVLLLHGGSGSAAIVHRVTCPAGDTDSPGCFVKEAADRGYIAVVPVGTPGPLIGHVWAAGGGVGPYRCTGSPTCEDGVDDVPFFEALLDEIGAWADVDPDRVFATGISNGGAMSYRLACDMPERIAGIASVAGMNAAETAPGCTPSEPVPVLHIHGTDDPCAPYGGGPPECPAGQPDLAHVSVEDSLLGDEGAGFVGWVAKNGCAEAPPIETALPDATEDGTRTVRQTWTACPVGGEVEHLKVEGGGHTWPGGYQELSVDLLGALATDCAANDEILDFFDARSL